MVNLIISSPKGNSGGRYFPFQGYLGLTPVRLEGTVRTRLDEDGKPMLAKSLSVSVRAYEGRSGRGVRDSTRMLVDYTQTLWRKSEGEDYTEIGDFEQPFKITLPKSVAGFSTANYNDYKTFWRVEAILEHIPSASLGSRLVKYFDLAFIRYDVPGPLEQPSPYLGAITHLPYITNKPRAPVLSYNLSTPTYPIGPSDLLFTSIHIRPQDPQVAIRSASILVERRIELLDTHTSPYSLHVQGVPRIQTSSSHQGTSTAEHDGQLSSAVAIAATYSSSTLDSTASTATITSRTPLAPLSPSAELSSSRTLVSPSRPSTASDTTQKTLTNTIAAADGSSFALDKSSDVWSKTISLQWPETRSHSRWSLGETMRGSLGSVSFWLRVKVIVTGPAGTDSIDLEPREVTAVLTNDTERRQALSHFASVREAREHSKTRTSPSRTHGPSSRTTSPHSPYPTSPPSTSPEPSNSRENRHKHKYVPPKSADQATVNSSSGLQARTMTGSAGMEALGDSELRIRGGEPSKRKAGATRTAKAKRPHTSSGPQDRSSHEVGFVPAMPIAHVAISPAPAAPSSPPPLTLSHSQSSLSSASSLSSPIISPSSPSNQINAFNKALEDTIATGSANLIREWEEELAKVESDSRRRSRDMAGRWGRTNRGRVGA